jgi:hypothetical protein
MNYSLNIEQSHAQLSASPDLIEEAVVRDLALCSVRVTEVDEVVAVYKYVGFRIEVQLLWAKDVSLG